MIKIFSLLALSSLVQIASSQSECKCAPTSSCWPSTTEWSSFNESLSGALIQAVPPGSVCYPEQPNYDVSLCNVALEQWPNSTWHAIDPVSIDYTFWTNNSCNPIFPNGTDINGNPGAGKAGCTIGNFPVYVVNATQAEQVSLALKFAAQRNIRVIVKNTGHNFLGKSTGYGSLSIWTHNLRGVEYINNFKPTSCTVNNTLQAVRVGAGETGIDVLNQIAKQDVIVVTGGNTDVGLAGWMTGGGHGYLSSTYGMGADNLLEATIVSPDGQVLIANPYQNQDLFFATRGGGGGTFGVLISAVVRAYPTPQTTNHNFDLTLLDPSKENEFWNMVGYIHTELPRLNAAGMAGYYFLYVPPVVPTFIFSWTMYIYDKPNGTVESLMQPIMDRLNNQSSVFSYGQQVSWYASFIDAYGLKEPEDVGAPAATMGSRLLSTESLSDAGRVTEVLASIGSSAKVTNPVIFSGSITASNQVPSYYPDLIGMTPAWRNTTLHLAIIEAWDETLDQTSVNEIFQDVTWNRTQPLRDLSPDTGAYLNECDYFEPDWQTSLYGPNYPRLYEIKQKYDPQGLFWCQRCVGSDDWVQLDDKSLCRPSDFRQ